MKSRIRTILIDDSAFMRRLISHIISSDDSIEVVGMAENGLQGFNMVSELKPDVVITDMIMPDFDGLYVVNSVMAKNPLPIILLSSLDKGDSRIFEALQHGALEFIDKPTYLDNARIRDYQLISLIKEASRTDVTLLKAKQLTKKTHYTHGFKETSAYKIIVIGASTGGPGAVEFIINNLPRDLKIPVVVVQHMPHRFLETFAERLNAQGTLPVKLAHKGESLKEGVVYVAPGEANMRIEQNIVTGNPMITFTERKYQEFNYPSVDCLFESVAENFGKSCIAVILTGMGKDGMVGLKKIRDNGGITIAQDEESSVVYGMPKAAFEAGAVKKVVSLKLMPNYIVNCL